jgi:hypothetical protein
MALTPTSALGTFTLCWNASQETPLLRRCTLRPHEEGEELEIDIPLAACFPDNSTVRVVWKTAEHDEDAWVASDPERRIVFQGSWLRKGVVSHGGLLMETPSSFVAPMATTIVTRVELIDCHVAPREEVTPSGTRYRRLMIDEIQV